MFWHDGHNVPLAKLAWSFKTQLTCPEEYAVMVEGNQPDLSMYVNVNVIVIDNDLSM